MKRLDVNNLKIMGLTLAQWIPSVLGSLLRRTTKPIHILFCMVDHYEPGHGLDSPELEQARVRRLLVEYPRLAMRHRDCKGRHPTRTWFFPPHYHRLGNLRNLVSLCEQGYGEIELHLHHGKCQPDNPGNLQATLIGCVQEYARFGIFGTRNGTKRYAFVHGDWALDNSRGGHFCGVNNELQILNQTGCYADFTFPSCNEANPFRINSIFYATDHPRKPKSYNTGIAVRRGGSEVGDLMLVQGPLFPFPMKSMPWLRYFGGEINGRPMVTQDRIRAWVQTAIHIRGKAEWVIIKTHTHGAMYPDAVLGTEMDEIFNELESLYNDGTRFLLHYVTARELFNIIKAVEADEPGSDPDEHRDYFIEPPRYDSSPNIFSASEPLQALIRQTYRG